MQLTQYCVTVTSATGVRIEWNRQLTSRWLKIHLLTIRVRIYLEVETFSLYAGTEKIKYGVLQYVCEVYYGKPNSSRSALKNTREFYWTGRSVWKLLLTCDLPISLAGYNAKQKFVVLQYHAWCGTCQHFERIKWLIGNWKLLVNTKNIELWTVLKFGGAQGDGFPLLFSKYLRALQLIYRPLWHSTGK